MKYSKLQEVAEEQKDILFSFELGTILTIDQRDKILIDGCSINMVPAFDFLSAYETDEGSVPGKN